VEVPKEGGEINEIVLKEKPRFINPVLGITNIDKSLISLIYTPLFEKDENGNLIENIASYEINETGKKYKIKLKKGILFHDGKEMTVDDIIFTIQQIQNPENNSFYRPE
jgi:peptide/nickel transport system substrate-binding protein